MAENLSTLSSDGLKGTPTGSGQRYTSIFTWEARGSDLVADGDTDVLECYDDWTGDGYNSGGLTITGWVTGSINTITIRPASGQGHGGVKDTGFRVYGSNSNPMLINQEYVTVEDFQCKIIATGNNHGLTAATQNITVQRMIIVGDHSDPGNGVAFQAHSSTYAPYNNLILRNCLVIQEGVGGSNMVSLFGLNPSTGVVVDNITIANGNHYGINSNSDNTATYTNIVSVNNTSGDFSGTASKTASNCASSDTTAFGTSVVENISTADGVDFVSPSTNDYTPQFDGRLHGAGLDLSGTFTDDIKGATRDAWWEIGAYDIVGKPTPADIICNLTTADTGTRPPSGPGADNYTNLSTWESAQQGDLVALDRRSILKCWNDWGGDGLAISTIIADWTTGPANNVIIEAAPGEGHGGVVDAGVRMYRDSGASPLNVRIGYVSLLDLQFSVTGAASDFANIIGTNNLANDLTVERCICVSKPTSAAASAQGINVNSVGGVTTLRNNLVISNAPSALSSHRGINLYVAGKSIVENNTVVGDWIEGIRYQEDGSGPYNSEINNNVAFGAINTDFSRATPGGIAVEQNNASGDTSAAGTDFVHNVIEGDFVNYAGGDYTPATSGKLDGAGANLSGTFTDDITGYTRSVPWEIGAYEIQEVVVAFDGPNIVAQTGDENEVFVFDENGEGTVASRFTVT
jgi:hypothetical protein